MTTTTATLTVRYFAAARAAAGVETESLEVAGTVDDAVRAIRTRHGAELGRVLDRCSFLLDEVAVRDRATPLPAGATLDVLPPFAGG
ncbi:MoaD/ThiS family protein [Pseudonocardia zijingensis]|jgi:molybdopterin converting factor small subunit|uniref:MoaD/ThiS family protein n=1 Tax=Pseudonocardia zijingensis TaxID=153376 RepID=A0ABN1PB22_9PSEU